METLIYGLAPNETESYMETLLHTKCKTEQDIKNVIEFAKSKGYHSFRIANYNGEKPDFLNTLNI